MNHDFMVLLLQNSIVVNVTRYIILSPYTVTYTLGSFDFLHCSIDHVLENNVCGSLPY